MAPADGSATDEHDTPTNDTTPDGTTSAASPAPRGVDGGADGLGDLLDRGVRTGARVVDRVRAQLPASPVPIYLGIGALAVTGVMSWPVAVAVGCGYAAFRHWEPQPSGMPHALPDHHR
jgi:hypothetical protein